MPYTPDFVGFHTRIASHEGADALVKLMDEALAPAGVNAIVPEFNPGYRYRCFPQYATGEFDASDAVKVLAAAKRLGMKVIPLFQCLSHQSDHMSGTPSGAWPYLNDHPEFMETPDVPGTAKWPDFYTHSWCASNDGVYEYVFPMMDELIAAFEADACHVGLDEVFDIGEDACPRCRGKDKAALFARTVKILHDHLAEKGVTMYMWGDRLLNAQRLGYQMWEADALGMWPAFDRADEVTRDIVICDWHYDKHDHGYPSIDRFMQGGFTVLPSLGWNPEQAESVLFHALERLYLGRKLKWPGKLGGYLFTQWRPLTMETADQILQGADGAEYDGKQHAVGVGATIRRCTAFIHKYD